ncbi:hypothetical protein D3C85_1752480 [compost metagenome]
MGRQRLDFKAKQRVVRNVCGQGDRLGAVPRAGARLFQLIASLVGLGAPLPAKFGFVVQLALGFVALAGRRVGRT